MNRALPRYQQILIFTVTVFAVRAFLGDSIGGFVDGLVAGFTNGI